MLDGGLPAWVASGRPEGPLDDSPEPVAAPRVQLDPRAFTDADDVARRLAEHDGAVADARSAERFAGTAPEPRPRLRAGHMPGAVSLPFSELAPGGHLLPPAELDDLLQQRLGGRGPVAFSCGSGVSACVGALAAVAEFYHDDNGLLWPRDLSPADLHVVATGKGPEVLEAAEEIVAHLEAAGISVLFDDRPKVSPGVKFRDAELLGVPTVLVVGRGLADGLLELKDRRSGTSRDIRRDQVVAEITAELQGQNGPAAESL